MLRLLRSWWDSQNVQVQSSNQGSRICWRSRLQLILSKFIQNELVDGGSRPIIVVEHRDARLRDRLKRPVHRVFSPFGDPLLEQIDVASRQSFAFWRHLFPFVGALYATKQFAHVRLTGNQSSLSAIGFGDGRISFGEPQSAFGLVRTMTGITMLGQNRSDISTEVDRMICLLSFQFVNAKARCNKRDS